MKIIPVLDLKNGVIVHARHGNREHYQAIKSRLCGSSNIDHVIDAFLSVYDFDTFYIADLDAIMHQGHHDHLIAKTLADYPHIVFWVDKGYQPHHSPLMTQNNYLPVLGSESYRDETVCELSAFEKRFILSLDYSVAGALGAQSLFSSPVFWPANIIVMTLACVGSNQGPDLQKLEPFCRQYPHKNFIAAGGIRHYDDLQALKNIGIKQALVASALHSGMLKHADIAKLQAKKYPGKPGYF